LRLTRTSMLNTDAAVEAAVGLFRTAYGGEPTVAASAPGRVNLIGEHLDYNGGPVLPVALDRRTAVVLAPAEHWEFVSTAHPDRVAGPDLSPGRGWADYLTGVVQELSASGVPPRGVRVAVASTVPIGAGLSSSAALTVAGAAAFGRLAGRMLTADELVEIAYHAEHDRVGVRCGRMDQTIAAHARAGHALLFETATGRLRHVPLSGRLWVVETGTSHRLIGGELNQRRRECELALSLCQKARPGLGSLAELVPGDLPALQSLLEPSLFRRVRHVVTEVARTRAAADALEAGDLPRLGSLLVEGHASLLNDYQSTVPEADFLVDAAMRHGAYGARLTGAGWGGAVVMLAPDATGAADVGSVEQEFRAMYGRTPAAWSTPAGAGVRIEPLGRGSAARTSSPAS
jgi:galactokinase